MKSAKQFISAFLLKEGLSYVEKDPVANLPKLVHWAERVVIREDHKRIAKMANEVVQDQENAWNRLIKRIMTELNPKVREKVFVNFLVNSEIYGRPLADKLKEKHGCNVPWAILMDPTGACNLNCIGCWAGEYDKAAALDMDLMERIILEGKELGIFMYIFSGGEPLVRKEELIQLAEEHEDCMFLAFTNGTLIDEVFAQELARVGNFALAISVEGFREETDMRRGEGTYDKVMEGMDYLKKYGVGFGFSTCYHSKNTEVVGSEAYLDDMIAKGCLFGWYFTYIPIGQGASMELIASAEQREYMYHHVRNARKTKPIFLVDFWNDGEYVHGCIAGGKNYFHINASGDVEPCAFIHYSNVNIKDVSVLDALRSPIFMEYNQRQPFNDNHLRPCPLLDNPDALREMVLQSNAHSTQTVNGEDVDELTDKCRNAARGWSEHADALWKKKEQKQ